MMSHDYSRAVIRVMVGQICRSLGWDAINASSLEVLVDFAERHMQHIGGKCQRYAEQFGRVDPSIDDLELAFQDLNINLKDLLEYTRNVEPIKLNHPVPYYPALSQTKLIFPHIEDEFGIPDPEPIKEAMAPSSENLPANDDDGSQENSMSSPTKGLNRSRLAIDVDNKKFRMRSMLMIEDGELTSMFTQGKGPAASRPPKPSTNDDLSRIITEPVVKPKLKTGAFKPKPKPAIPEEVATDLPAKQKRTPTPPHPPTSVSPPPAPPEKIKQKPEKKKKKKAPVAPTAPEGFNDIFGAPLEKTSSVKKSSKSQSKKSLSHGKKKEVVKQPEPVNLVVEKVENDRLSDDQLSDSEDLVLEIDESDPAVKARLRKYDAIIDDVVATNKTEISRTKMAEEAFMFEDRPVTPVATKIKSSKQKKSKSPSARSRSRSPVSRPGSKVDDTIDSVLKMASTDNERVPAVPSGQNSVPEKPKKDKKKKKNRREQLLERFAAAPLESFSVTDSQREPEPVVPLTPPKTADVPDVPEQFVPGSPTEEPLDVPPAEEEEETIVNVDEDSDIDVLGASSPTPPPQNPYSAYQIPQGIPTLNTYAAAAVPLDVTDSYTPVTNTNWHAQDDAEWHPGQSQTIDFASHTAEKKEKHKKEKKEKKEKKKKKHKEKDKERSEDKIKHRSKEHHERHHDGDESQDAVPRLTLKIGGQNIPAQQDIVDSVDKAEVNVPKLVIKSYPGAEVEPNLDSSYDGSSLSGQIFPQPVSGLDYAVGQPIVTGGDDDKVWICPACHKPDDGSPMIGCDGCDEWFHWPCVGIVSQPPDDVEWFCPDCAKKEKKRKKKKKKEKHKQLG